MIDAEFPLPVELRPLWEARIAVRDFYRQKNIPLEFTFDGNLVGDIGEACAVEWYSMELVERRSTPGIDGYAPDGRTVQVKAKGTRTKSIAFSYAEARADHLLVLVLDFEHGTGQAIYNGPEHYIREFLPREPWNGQAQVSLTKLKFAAERVQAHERMLMKH